jgi:hypothetical protein
MGAPPTGISEADWSATPVGVRAGFLELLQHGQEQQQEIEQLRVSGDSENWSGGDTKTGPPCGANH